MGAVGDRRLCRLRAERRPRAVGTRADPPRHRAPHVRLSRPGHEAAGPRRPVARQPRRPRWRGRDARHAVSPPCRRRRARWSPTMSCRSARRPSRAICRHRRALPQYGLSLGRPHQPRARLLGARATVPCHRRSSARRATPTFRKGCSARPLPAASKAISGAAISSSGKAMSASLPTRRTWCTPAAITWRSCPSRSPRRSNGSRRKEAGRPRSGGRPAHSLDARQRTWKT